MKRFLSSFSVRKNLIFYLIALLMAFSASGQNLPTATETASSMGLGWNIGNTLEAIGGERAWGNPLITQQLIDSAKAAGFKTIRLPVSWDKHANQSTMIIDAEWMARIKQVVDYCINDKLYVVLNIHWDGGWLENNCTSDKQASVNQKQNSYWTQIANTFKNYDGHLLFASANEPNVDSAAQMGVLMSYHQTFVDAVRATGGNNSSRVLVIQGPSTDIEKTNKMMNSLPTDQIPNHMMVEIHYYSPSQFTLLEEDATWGKMFYFWGKDNHSTTNMARNPTWGEERYLDSCFTLMKNKFIDKGIPVIIGEFCVAKRNLSGADLALHLTSRNYYHKYLVGSAIQNGLIPIFWDTGSLLDRNTGAVIDKETLQALKDGLTFKPIKITIKKTISGSSGLKASFIQNPVSKSFNLVLSDPEQVKKLSIFDQLGRRVSTFDQSSIQKTMQIGQGLKAGTYIVQINSTSGEQSLRVFIAN
jgi:endoglucanase